MANFAHCHAFRRVVDFEVEGQRKKGRPKRTWTWKREVKEESKTAGMEDVVCRSKWIARVNQVATRVR